METTTKTTPFDGYELLDALANVGIDVEDEDVSNSYSGRGMYGARCLAIVHAAGQGTMIGVALLAAAVARCNEDGNPVDLGGAIDAATRLAQSARQDSMGHGTVTYFPGWVLKDGE